jgi:hypothetical protein
MLSTALFYVAGPLIFSLAVCLFALTKGDAPERFGAAVILANMVVSMTVELAWRSQIALLANDGLTALLLLVIAVRYASFWLGGVMLLYALQFALHAFYFVAERPRDSLHVILNNLDFFAVSVCLAAGTAVAWRRRLRLAAAAALG